MLIDTHAHLDAEEFDQDRAAVVARAHEAGVPTILSVGTTAKSSEITADLAAEFPNVYAAVGIQPNYCAEAQQGDWERIVELLAKPGVVAIGETGLDRYWDYAPLEVQRDYFDRHIRLSQKSGLPLIIHLRESEAEILEMLRDAQRRGSLSGVMHSYTGSSEGAAECLEMGLYISFAGMVTFKKSDDLRTLATKIPAERILVETDSPYLSPHPLRGKRNEPANVVHTARCLAEARGEDPDEFARQTTANARRLFGFNKE